MIAGAPFSGRAFSFDRPTFQWDALRGTGTLTVRLFGRLGGRELEQVAEAVARRGRSPRDLVCIDFEQVEHLDYRALPELMRALARQQNRGACICLVGLSRYVRNLFDVVGQGPALRRMEWKQEGESVAPRRPFPGFTAHVRIPGGERRGIRR